MKLSYQNIAILADLFEGVEIIYDTCDCEPFDCRGCEPWAAQLKIGKIVFYVGDNDIEGDSCNTYGRINFTEETTVADFKTLCAHLGVELVEKVDFNYAMDQERKAYIEDMEIEARDRESFFK